MLGLVRGRNFSHFARVKRGKVAVAGVVAGRPNAAELARLLRGAGV